MTCPCSGNITLSGNPISKLKTQEIKVPSAAGALAHEKHSWQKKIARNSAKGTLPGTQRQGYCQALSTKGRCQAVSARNIARQFVQGTLPSNRNMSKHISCRTAAVPHPHSHQAHSLQKSQAHQCQSQIITPHTSHWVSHPSAIRSSCSGSFTSASDSLAAIYSLFSVLMQCAHAWKCGSGLSSYTDPPSSLNVTCLLTLTLHHPSMSHACVTSLRSSWGTGHNEVERGPKKHSITRSKTGQGLHSRHALRCAWCNRTFSPHLNQTHLCTEVDN